MKKGKAILKSYNNKIASMQQEKLHYVDNVDQGI